MDDAQPAQAAPRRGRLTLWLLLAVCVLPFAAALLMLTFGSTPAGMNYGELIVPQPLAEFSAPWLEGNSGGNPGTALGLAGLRGHWTLVQVDTAACGASCREKLYDMRQVRLALGKNMDRVQRLWIVSDEGAIDPLLQKDYAGTLMVRGGGLLRQLPAGADPRAHIWLIDPLGNVMLRYAQHPQLKGMKNDLDRLLSVSQID